MKTSHLTVTMLGQVFLHVWCHWRAGEGIVGDARDTGNIDKLRVALSKGTLKNNLETKS
jgi:hypothetical protein